MRGRIFSFLVIGGLAACLSMSANSVDFRVEVLVDGDLVHPFGMAFLPNGDLLITERIGRLRRFAAGKLHKGSAVGLPTIEQHGQGGLLGIALHPNFARNQLLYLSYAGKQRDRYSTELMRARYVDGNLVEPETIFAASPKSKGGRHFGGRIVFDRDDYLYLSLGDRGNRPSAQDLSSHNGSLIRLHDDGRIPQDNPFVGVANARKESFTLGNRNMQGMVLNPSSGVVWTHEHGPQGGDEVNIMRAGVNYGWPVITYGRNYGIGTKIGEGTHKDGMAQPIHKWVPSIAPSGMTFYTGDAFPAWSGDLFVGSLKFGLLVRLDVDGDRIVGEERFFDGDYGRIRDVIEGPDGAIYVLTADSSGSLLRLVPN